MQPDNGPIIGSITKHMGLRLCFAPWLERNTSLLSNAFINPLARKFILELSMVEGPVNDVCYGAMIIHPNTTTISGSLANAIGAMDSNTLWEYSSEAGSVWYLMNGMGGVYVISTRSSK